MNNKTIAKIVRDVEKDIRIKVYSNRYAIISFVHENGECSPSEMAARYPSSSSTFYESLKALTCAGVLRAEGAERDLRRTKYRLDPAVRAFVDRQHRELSYWFGERLKLGPFVPMTGYLGPIKAIEERTGVRYYSSEFEAIICLYERIQASAGEIYALNSASSTAFYQSLRRLNERGVLQTCQDHGDRRLKYYALSETVRSALDDAHTKIIGWDLLRAAGEYSGAAQHS